MAEHCGITGPALDRNDALTGRREKFFDSERGRVADAAGADQAGHGEQRGVELSARNLAEPGADIAADKADLQVRP